MTINTHCSDVLIVGAGITGIASAVALAEKGVTVTVVERYSPAAMASGWTLAGVRQSGRDPAELALAKRAVELWQTLDIQLGSPTGYR
ncbi:MAG: sarcosine oxidase subunit beta, partial [bacterium]